MKRIEKKEHVVTIVQFSRTVSLPKSLSNEETRDSNLSTIDDSITHTLVPASLVEVGSWKPQRKIPP